MGPAAAGLTGSIGVNLTGSGAAVTASDGPIDISGQRRAEAGATESNYGVYVGSGATATSTGTGPTSAISVQGTSVQLDALVSANAGNITITATDAAAGTGNDVGIGSSGQVSSTGGDVALAPATM